MSYTLLTISFTALFGFLSYLFIKKGNIGAALFPVVVFVVSFVSLLGVVKDTINLVGLKNSDYLEEIFNSLSIVETSSAQYRLKTDIDSKIEPQKPYAIMDIECNKSNGIIKPVKLLKSSKGMFIDDKGLKQCRTLVFCISETWDSATYKSITSNTIKHGSSERKICYLYDVDTGKLFNEIEIKAARLPSSSTGGAPQYSVHTEDIVEKLEQYMK